jgi:nitrogenase molybdenum-iron protein alpha chain
VPLVAPPPPLGSAATTRWLTALGGATGHAAQAALVASCHARHAHRLQRSAAALAGFAGAQVVVNLPGPLVFGVIELLAELGLQTAAIKLPSVGAPEQAALRALAERQPQLPVLVGEGQAFEEVNLLRRLAPALYIGHGEPALHALRLGIPVLDLAGGPLHGYAGAEAVAAAIAQRLRHPALAYFLGGGVDASHTAGWLGRSTSWYIKQEVR